jgi:octaprenyl-diphosphate synthase
MEDTIECARQYGVMAQDSLSVFAPTPWKRALFDVVDFCISRGH